MYELRLRQCALLCALRVSVAAPAAVPTLADHPIAGDAFLSLTTGNGASWTADSPKHPVPPPPAKCTFKAGFDWNEGVDCPLVQASTQQECCDLCHARAGCMGSTFYQGKCFFKSAADVSKGLKPGKAGVVACVKGPSARPPPPPVPSPSKNDVITINATVPGDLVTDLQNAGLIGDPLFEVNFRNSSLWHGRTWTYRTTFDTVKLSDATGSTDVLLVLDGVKMGARVFLNNQLLGTVSDQFLRYSFSAKSALKAAGQSNQVAIEFDESIEVDGRFMACSGGWDWAPYTTATDSQGLAMFTKGIWKDIYLVRVGKATISHVVPQVEYLGAYPTARLVDGHAPFEVRVQVHIVAPAACVIEVAATGEWGGQNSTTATLPAGETMVELVLPADSVNLWWPNNAGNQTMYNVNVSLGATTAPIATSSRRIGFRFLAFVTEDDQDPAAVLAKGEGTGSFTMRFRVNGVNLYVRGSNLIPMEVVEGRANATALHRLVQSAQDANFNMLRVWGGGIFQYSAFYDACDDAGILLFHDMQYAQLGHVPHNTTREKDELTHQIRRLSHHPCVAIYDGCNECSSKGRDIYTAFVMSTVAAADQSHSIWPSCPASGWKTGVDRLTGRPNGNLLNANGPGVNDSHGPYVTGNGFATDEQSFWDTQKLITWNPDTTANFVAGQDCSRGACKADTPIHPVPTNSTTKGWFKSEFGCVVMSSFESLEPMLDEQNYGLHSPPMYERNWNPDNVIWSYFGMHQDLNATGIVAFKKQLYQSMIAQALFIKSEIDGWRSSNVWGTLIWQLNEVWPTGGWGSIEYGAAVPGQVTGGRWKPLHYWLKASVFADVTGSCCARCSPAANCYVKNDGAFDFSGSVTVESVEYSTAKISTVLTQQLHLAAGAQTMQWLSAGMFPATETHGLILTIYNNDSARSVHSRNELILAPPVNLTLPPVQVSATVAPAPSTDDSVEITVRSVGGAAVYVVLTTKAQGRFSDNAFMVVDSSSRGRDVDDHVPVVGKNTASFTKTVRFLPWGKLDLELLKTSLRVEHLQQNL